MLPLAYGSADVTRILRGILKKMRRGATSKDRSLATARLQRNPGDKMTRLNEKEALAVSITEAQVRELLQQTQDPNTGKDYVSSKEIKQIKVESSDVAVQVVLGYPANSQLSAVGEQIEHALRALPGVGNVSGDVSWKIVAHSVQGAVQLIPGVRNIISVASGKGGVGKSTVAVNLALALAAEGAAVGLLDADIYGPSQPTMLGIRGRPETRDGKSIEPMVGHGVQAMSIGFMIDVETPMVWRGPMVTQAL